MIKVEFNSKNANPFYGMRNTLELFQTASKGIAPTKTAMTASWNEAQTTEQKALLLSIFFFVGDVTSRQHNLFEGKVDGGGNAQREVFRDTIIPFLVANVAKTSSAKKLALMKLIVEYTTMDNIFAARVKTAKKTDKVVSVLNMIKVFGLEDVASFAANIILKGTTFEKICLAKFLTRPRFSKRPGKTKMLPETVEIMSQKAELLKLISQKTALLFEEKGSYTNFSGFYTWRKEFNKDFESVLFSTQSVKDMDREQFFQMLEKSPSDARFRIRNRVMFSDKWGQLKGWYTEWEQFKEAKQKEQRVLETKIANGLGTQSDVNKLQTVKKEAKVNTGAISFTEMFKQIVTGTVDEIKIQPFLDKIKLPYNSLVFADDSGSMDSSWGTSKTLGFTPRQFAAFIATIILSKNPDAEARDLIGLFSKNCRMFNGISSLNKAPNSLLAKNVVKTAKTALIDSEDTFLNNLRRMKQFLDAETTGNSTNISSIPENLNQWVAGDASKLEALQRFPIWTLISDGNFNNLGHGASSLNDFMKKCENYFGFRPFLILIDVAGNTSQPITQFSGIDNVMMVPPNPANIETFLTNFKDMDTYDVYTPLQSIYRSGRYAPVRAFAGDKTAIKTETLEVAG